MMTIGEFRLAARYRVPLLQGTLKAAIADLIPPGQRAAWHPFDHFACLRSPVGGATVGASPEPSAISSGAMEPLSRFFRAASM